MNNLFNDALKGLQKFGDDLAKSINDAQEQANKKASKAQFASARNFTPQERPLPPRVVHSQISAHLAPVDRESVLSPASSVSPAPSVSLTSSEGSVQSESGDSQRSDASKSSYLSLMKVINELMGRDNGNAPLNQAPSSFDSKNPENNNNKESGKGFSAMFTSLYNSAISFFKNLSKEESAKQQKTSSTEEPQKRVKQKPQPQPQPQPQQSSNGYGGGLWKKLIPNGVFFQAENKKTGQAVRLELPFVLPKIGFDRHQVVLPTAKEVKKSAQNFRSYFKAKAGNAGGALAGAYGVASEGFNTQNARNNLRALASGVSFLASSSPSGSPSAFSAKNLRSGLSFEGSESMATTIRSFVSAVSSGSGRSASYGSRYGNSGVRLSGGWLR